MIGASERAAEDSEEFDGVTVVDDKADGSRVGELEATDGPLEEADAWVVGIGGFVTVAGNGSNVETIAVLTTGA